MKTNITQLLVDEHSLAERVIPETMRPGIREGYQAAEAHVGEGFGGEYEAVGAAYEIEFCS